MITSDKSVFCRLRELNGEKIGYNLPIDRITQNILAAILKASKEIERQ